MEWADSDPLGPGWPDELAGVNADLAQLVAAAADLCRKPLRHGVVLTSAAGDPDCCMRLEVRDGDGQRQPEHDLELEIYRSGSSQQRSLHFTLAWLQDDAKAMLWHGSHAVWMDPSGLRCERPQDGEALEALARRLRALLVDLS
jgi:hypothetical protein